jgi:hypothetical protein
MATRENIKFVVQLFTNELVAVLPVQDIPECQLLAVVVYME